jgi:pyruvate dehydrogenase E2 component (dihydrolipoamide acetyltransferase)
MSTIIEMPKLSDTMTVGTVVKWHKKAGDRVSNGDILAEIETDKATMELENFDDGTLLKIFVEEGEEADIGSALAVVGEEGEVIPEIPAGNDNKDQSNGSEVESDEEHIEPILPEQKN